MLQEEPMAKITHLQKTFEKIDYSAQKLVDREFHDCTFKNCDFSNSNLSGNEFTDCTFDTCNLSMVKLDKTKLNQVSFIGCKLMGVDFSVVNVFILTVGFKSCMLHFANFSRLKLKKTEFEECSIKEANFSESDLKGATFNRCDLERTIFDRSNLETADFRTAYHFNINPEENMMRKARFSAGALEGLLIKYQLVID